MGCTWTRCSAELDEYLDDLDVTWFADHEAQDALRKGFPAHRTYPKIGGAGHRMGVRLPVEVRGYEYR